MKHKKLSLLILMFIYLGNMQAQETNPTSGGEATGSGGSASYSIGQVVYTTNTGSNGSLAQGVQQPYEISVVTGISEAGGIQFELKAYPNPTRDVLNLRIENYTGSGLDYYLYDLSGQQLISKKQIEKQTLIPMGFYVPGTYFLKVMDGKNEIRTFKIIKN